MAKRRIVKPAGSTSATPPAVALARILAQLADVAPLPPETAPLGEALGRALAEDLVAPAPLPAFDVATMDGYALRAADVPRAGARLPEALVVYAGAPADRALPRGACARIFTGAPLPRGADAVEQQEEISRGGDGVRFQRAALPGRFVRRRGSDVGRGEVALRRGEPLDAGGLALAAALGQASLRLHRRPRVAILPTGDELAGAGHAPGPGQIIESNGIALAAAAWEAGAEPDVLPPIPDDPRALARALRLVRRHDAVVTVGGVSVGERDLVRAALVQAGARLESWRVAMRPGKPFTFGRWGRTAVFGLPGNPASALVTFELFVRPALRALAGLPGAGRLVLPARLAAPAEKPAGLTTYLRARLRADARGLAAVPLASQLSGDLSSSAGVDALAILPPGRSRFARGARIDVVVLRAPSREQDR
ncbi:MAG TPA: gephyrin-like molybdotransferase Glp [Anaeromyxobacteraceae bacterium]|nr:gephyrin-like molybdotransferase Glp [Anaeromyxobacteraceae bacterium]